MDPTVSRRWRAIPILLSFLVVLGGLGLPSAAQAFTWPWNTHDPWPSTSDVRVTTLDHPVLPEQAPPEYRFAVYGDQRALADGEWQELISLIAREQKQTPFLFVLDTGDLVDAGQHSDQFHMLHDLLAPISNLPYLVSVGNHELRNNKLAVARQNTARFLAYLDDSLSSDRMYYRKEIGPVTYIFLDTNDLIYGDDGDLINTASPPPGSRAEAQMKWLCMQLDPQIPRGARLVVVMHHPFLQSSKKHGKQGRALWSYRYGDRFLPDIFADAGVDLVITGHTHTYERFFLERDDGRSFALVNFSGRPRASFLWFGDGARRAHDIAGMETEYLAGRGWENLDRWRITQVEAMTADEANQAGVFTVSGDGTLRMQVHYLDDASPEGYRAGETVVF